MKGMKLVADVFCRMRYVCIALERGYMLFLIIRAFSCYYYLNEWLYVALWHSKIVRVSEIIKRDIRRYKEI